MTNSHDNLADAFPGDSLMSQHLRAHDWSSHPLGAPHAWPEGLKVPLRMMLTSRFEMWLGWGDELNFFYNDSYIPTLGIKHPQAIGKPMREVWREIYSDVEDRIVSVMRDGTPTWDKALMLLLERSGFPEETYHTFSYSPLRGDSGSIQGLMCVVTEETQRVIGERRIDTLRELATRLLPARSRKEVIVAAAEALKANLKDFPFSVLYLFEGALVASTAEDPGDAREIEHAAWPFDAFGKGADFIRRPLHTLTKRAPRGAWNIAPRDVLVTPVMKPGQSEAIGALVLGLNPYRPFDEGTGAFVKLIAGQIAGAIATVDMQAQAGAETERLRQLFEQSPSFIAILRGPQHRFEMVNPGYMQVIGHRDVIGRTVRESLPDLEGQGFFELLDTVYVSGQPFAGRAVSVHLQHSAGAPREERYLDFVYQPITGPDGSVTGIFVEGIDVTATHNAVAALRESGEQFRTLSEAMPNQVWTSRADGDLDWFNSRVMQYSGLAPHDLEGQGWTRIVHPDDLPAATKRWIRSLASGATYETEFRLLRRDGRYRWHIARAVALRNERGEINRWIGTNTDIDDQKTAAQALLDLTETLEKKVQQRTSELMAAEEALRQSQKMEAVGQLTGGIAHDFNNLLAAISGSLELIDTRVKQNRLSAITRYIDAAQGAVKRAASLTQRLLAFSRRQTLDPKPININRLIADMEELIRRTVGPSIEIEVVGAGGLWPTLVDPHQLENALLNLCINARDAMPDGGRLTIETANKWLDDRAARDRELPPGQYISLCVTDTGTGMSPEVISRAFDPFFTTKPIGEGTGLGLSMIYGFVRQSGGQVRIYSEVGQGTTMCLYLPRHLGEVDDQAAGASTAMRDSDGHGETVLVIDDEPTVRMLIVDVLEEAGYKTIEAPDGPAGLKVLQSDARIDLLITDVGLPGGLNGRQVADAGRSLRPGLKVLFITGYAENAAVRNGFLDPGMQVVTKPFTMDTLSNKIREMIDSKV